jgi:hypothetical protein
MFFSRRSPDYVTELERIGNEALGRLRAKDATVEHQRNLALNELKQLAVQKAIIIERLRRASFEKAPRLDDPVFKRKVKDTAAELLFQSHLHFSIDG